MIGKGEPGAERHLGGHDAVPAEEILLAGKHVHRSALAVRIPVAAPGQFGHDALRVHTAGEHVPVVAVAGDDLVALFDRHLHADDHGFLADIEVAEAADEAHAVHLTSALLEAADEQHALEGLELLVSAEIGKLLGR